MKKSFIALFLMFVSVVSMAETSQGENFASTSNDDNIARAEAGGEIIASGSIKGYTWTLDAMGNFVMSGEDENSGTLNFIPWTYGDKIKNIKFKGKIRFSGDCTKMFANLNELISVDFGNVNTTEVTSMNSMFANCRKLLTVNVSSFDTSNVRDMRSMFADCNNLVFVDITNFNISNLNTYVGYGMDYMFQNCKSLIEMDLSGIRRTEFVCARNMFDGCSRLARIDITDFFTDRGTDFNGFFNGCNNLKTIICDTEDRIPYLEGYNPIREHCNTSNAKVYVPPTRDNIYRSYWSMYSDKILQNEIVYEMNGAKLDVTGRVKICYDYNSRLGDDFWKYNSDIKTVKFQRSGSSYDDRPIQVSSFYALFANLRNLKTVYWGNIVTSQRTMNSMFRNCECLVCFNMPYIDTSQIDDVSFMFEGCQNLIAVNMSHFDSKHLESSIAMFADCIRLVSLDVSNFDTSNVRSMRRMFANCGTSGYFGYYYDNYSLTTLDLSNFKLGQVENVSEMFSGCSSLTSLVLPGMTFGYNADNVFTGCSRLKNIILNHNNDIPEGSVSYVVDNYERFFASIPAIHNCTLSLPLNNLLPLSNTGDWKYVNSIGNLGYGDNLHCFWDIDKYGNLLIWPKNGVEGWIYRPSWEAYVANIKTGRFAGIVHADDCCEMFKGLNQLTSIDLSCFDSSGVTDMREMFYGCSSLTSLNLSNFDTSNVTDMDRMFYGCSSLKSLGFSNFTNLNISGNPYYIFYRCYNLKDITVYAVTPPSLKGGTFSSLSSQCNLNVPSESLLSYTCADEWKNLYSICSIGNIGHGIDGGCFWDIDKNGSLMVWPRNGVEGQMSNDATWNSSQDCCKYIKTGRFAGTVYAPVDCSGLFAECNSLSSLDLSNLNTRYVANMSHMFENCRSLSSIDFSNFDTNNVTDMSYMFNNCESLSELDLSNFDTRNVENMDYIFRECDNLDFLTFDRFFTPDWSRDIFYNTNPREIVFKSIPYIGNPDLKRLDTRVILDLSDASYIHEGPNDFPSVIKATYTRSVTNKWGTIVLPFNARMGDTYDFYQVNNIKNDNLNLKKISALPAGTPAIFCVNDGETKLTCTLSYGMYFHINTNLNPVPAGELTLVGTFSELDLTYREGFIIANDKFWNIQDIRGDNWVGIKPFRAYLAGSLSSGANSLGISFDDTEDVDAVEAISDVENGEMEFYDLNGRRLNRLQNGVNIVKLGNGKTRKILVE